MREKAISIIQEILQNIDDNQKEIYEKMLQKVESIDEKTFEKIAIKTFGRNPTEDDLRNYLISRAQKKEHHDFKPINDTISYHIQEETTLCLHLIPEKVSQREIRESGNQLLDALTQIRQAIEKGEFETVNTIFAVSDILKLKYLQEYFNELGFKVDQAPDFKKLGFKNPYAAAMKKDDLLSKDWLEKSKKFKEKNCTLNQKEENEIR